MSLFIIQEHQFFENIESIQQEMHVCSKKLGLIQKNCNHSRKPDSSILLASLFFYEEENSNSHHYIFDLQQLGSQYKVVYSGKGYQGINKLSFLVRLLVPNEGYYKFPNGYALTQICSKISRINNQDKLSPLKLSANPNTREVKIIFPDIYGQEYSLLSSSLISKVAKEKTIFRKIVRPYLEEVKTFFMKALKGDSHFEGSYYYNNQDKKDIQTLIKYSEMSSIAQQFSIDQIIKQQDVKKAKDFYSEDSNNCKNHLGQYIRKITNSYSSNTMDVSQKHNYVFSQQEIYWIKRRFEIVLDSKNQSSVLNYIYIKDQNSIQMNKINEGGFADIYTAEVKYWEVSSENLVGKTQRNEKEGFVRENMKEQVMAIKKSIPQIYNGVESDDSARIKHQISILKIFKDQKPTFLPKYYIPRAKTKKLSSCLFMDYLDNNTLTDFLKQTRMTLSLINKMYIMFALVQALRRIRDYRVVHLDLKPSNIMMNPKMLIKIIDFGQSYHPTLTNTPFKPGFTLPYSCPELYQDKTQFTTKADVFSMGIIFFEIFYNRCPFNFFTSTTHSQSAMKMYEQLWLFTPEEAQTYGEQYVFRTMNNLIGKCLASDPENRPELDWVALILRKLIEMIS